jgi:hypothetical protein
MRTRLGTQQFVHLKRPDDCIGRPESLEHEYLKTLVARTVVEVGWDSEIEAQGPNRKWIADVLAKKNKAKLAFEIQLSPITHAELIRRSRSYAENNVRACWFVKGSVGRDFLESPSTNLPVFLLQHDDQAELRTIPFYVTINPQHRLPIKDAVTALLNREFKWCRKRRVRTIENILVLRLKNCWVCRGSFDTYTIEGNETRCDEAPRSTYLEKRRLLQPELVEAVHKYAKVHPELALRISDPAWMLNSSLGCKELAFVCVHCGYQFSFQNDSWFWRRNSETIVTIPFESKDHKYYDPHWCHSKDQDFCC